MTEIKIPSNQSAPDSSPDSTSILSKLPTYFKENPFLTLLNLGLIIGGSIAFTFFAKIEYLPDLDLNDATSLLIGIALIGIVASLALSICLLLPSWLIQTLWSELHNAKASTAKSDDLKALKEARSTDILFSGTLVGVITFFGWILALNLYSSFDWELLGGGIVVLLVFALIQVYRYRRASKKFKPEIIELAFGNNRKFVFFNLGLFAAWLIPCFLLILISIDSIITLNREANWGGIIAGLGLLILVVFSNSLLAALHITNRDNRILIFQSYIFIALALLVSFLGLPGNPISLVNTPFRILHLGDIQNSFFIVKEDTCNTFNTLIPASCSKIDKAGCIHPKSVASRIGSEYLLVFEGPQIPNKKPKDISVPLKKEDVLGWSFGSGAEMPQACSEKINNSSK